jgi:hypothetical protein
MGELRCPLCGEKVSLGSQRHLQKIEREVSESVPGYAPGWLEAFVRATHNVWCCAACLAGGRAVAGDPRRQVQLGPCRGPTLDRVVLAWVDRWCTCRDCGAEFGWTAREQREFHEVHGTRMAADVVRCVACRARHADFVEGQRELERLLRELDERNPASLLQVAFAYAALGYAARATEFARRARNRARPRGEWERLEAWIAERRNRGEPVPEL